MNYPGMVSCGEATSRPKLSWELSIEHGRTRQNTNVTTLKKGGNLVRRL
jgi:hypothetical protein